jgi:hypothetical protein
MTDPTTMPEMLCVGIFVLTYGGLFLRILYAWVFDDEG